MVAAGGFAEVAKEHPFPSQLFFYGFEHAIALAHEAGRRVDLQPMRELESTPLSFIDFKKIQDPSTMTSDIPQMDENSLRAARDPKAESGRNLATRIFGRTIRGVSGDWAFIRHFGRSGNVHERVWRQGLMRLWSRRGTAFASDDELCMEFPPSARQCIARVYELDGVTYAFSEGGMLVAAFRWLPTDFRLPPDLRD